MDTIFQKEILIVEDSKLNAQIAADILERYGYKTEIVFSGEKAIEKIISNEKSPDLILMDIELSGKLDGIDAAKIIGKHKDIPIIFLTANANREIMEKIKSVSAYGYILKGVDESVIISQIEMAFNLYEARHEIKSREEMFHSMFENHDVAMILVDAESGHIVYANKAACEFCRYPKDIVQNMDIREVADFFGVDGYESCWEMLKRGCNPCVCIQNGVNGSEKIVNVYSTIIDYQDKKLIHLIVFDITEEWEIKRKLEFYSKLFEDSLNEIYIFDAETLKFIFVNRGARKNLGYSEEELKKMTPLDIKIEFTLQSFKEFLKPLLNGKQMQLNIETMHRRKDGSLYPVVIHIELMEYDGEKVFVAFVADLTEQRKIENDLMEKNEILNTITAYAGDAIIMIDGYGKVTFWNPAAERILGYSKDEILGKELHTFMILDEQLYSSYKKAIEKFRHSGEGSIVGKTVEMKTVHKKGHEIDVELSLSVVKINGSWHAIGIIRDISERKKFEELLYLRSVTDPLTGIYNRRFFMDILEKEVEMTKRNKKPFSLIMFDLDHFKNVNDYFGHAAGDMVLKRVVEIVKERIRKTDCFARWGGEEFIIFLPETSLNNASDIAEELRFKISTAKFDGVGNVTASFGATDFKENDNIDTVLLRLDNMLYEAKNNGRNCVCVG
ncbi:PAS domain S-box protein [Thermoanaerobacterium thermosulfurigenes]|uniref:GGDEF domain-containing response regulator n=1 Tax=Thermoanaerobacterium thermosulfurigenes TaxID=33950 RepID=UPI003F4A128D